MEEVKRERAQAQLENIQKQGKWMCDSRRSRWYYVYIHTSHVMCTYLKIHSQNFINNKLDMPNQITSSRISMMTIRRVGQHCYVIISFLFFLIVFQSSQVHTHTHTKTCSHDFNCIIILCCSTSSLAHAQKQSFCDGQGFLNPSFSPSHLALGYQTNIYDLSHIRLTSQLLPISNQRIIFFG